MFSGLITDNWLQIIAIVIYTYVKCNTVYFLGWLFDRVDLIKSTKSFFDVNEIWYVRRGQWVMHDGMQYDPIQGQGHEPFRVGNPANGHFQKLSSLPFTVGPDNWPRILKLGHNI